MKKTIKAWDIIILRGKVGFPEGLWMSLCYRHLADEAVRMLADDGVIAVARVAS